ncbi:hypothetical protein Bpfe_008588, partial [Biomphalaria pfeifferi]
VPVEEDKLCEHINYCYCCLLFTHIHFVFKKSLACIRMNVKMSSFVGFAIGFTNVSYLSISNINYFFTYLNKRGPGVSEKKS